MHDCYKQKTFKLELNNKVFKGKTDWKLPHKQPIYS